MCQEKTQYRIGWIISIDALLKNDEVCNSKMNIKIPFKYSSLFKIYNYNIWIHIWNASRYPDLGRLLRHWLMSEPRAFWYLYRRPDMFLRFGKRKQSHGSRYEKYDGCGKTETFSKFRNRIINRYKLSKP